VRSKLGKIGCPEGPLENRTTTREEVQVHEVVKRAETSWKARICCVILIRNGSELTAAPNFRHRIRSDLTVFVKDLGQELVVRRDRCPVYLAGDQRLRMASKPCRTSSFSIFAAA
jgi:hypothetical protein